VNGPEGAAGEVGDSCPHCHHEVVDSWLICAWCGEQLAAAAELDAGVRLADGRYQILRVLGRGGFGITYDVGDRRLQRRVAMKELFPESAVRHGAVVLTPPQGRAAFKAARDRFLREARVLARFTHPGIVRVYEVFEEHGTAYLVMELLEGRTLVQLLQERGTPFPERELLDVAGRVAAALRPVHAAGVLHRDINPSNVMMTHHGRIVVIDFGLARDYDQDETRGMTRVVTPGYAPLEQYRGSGRFGPSTDVYGLAATLYRLGTGRVPMSAIERDAGGRLPTVHDLNPAISKSVSDAILDGLELVPSHRPQDIDSFLARLGIVGLPEGPRSLLIDLLPPPARTGAPVRPSPGAAGRAPSVLDRPAGAPPTPRPAPIVGPPTGAATPPAAAAANPAGRSPLHGRDGAVVASPDRTDRFGPDDALTNPDPRPLRPGPADGDATDAFGSGAGASVAVPRDRPRPADAGPRPQDGAAAPGPDATGVTSAWQRPTPATAGASEVARATGTAPTSAWQRDRERPTADARTTVANGHGPTVVAPAGLAARPVGPPPELAYLDRRRSARGGAAPRGADGRRAVAGSPGWRSVVWPLAAVAVAWSAAVPVLAVILVAALVLPLLATAGDSQAHRERDEAGVANGWAEQRMSPRALAGPRLVRNMAFGVARGLPALGLGAVLLLGWYGIEGVGAASSVLDALLRLVGVVSMVVLLTVGTSGAGRYRPDGGLERVVAWIRPDGRVGERAIVVWVVALGLVAAALLLRPTPFPLP
jgi:serine/threonine-protein kinase